MCTKCNNTQLLSKCCGEAVDGNRCSLCKKFCKKIECKFCNTSALIDTPNYSFSLYQYFKGVEFNDNDHTYEYDETPLVSVTTKIKQVQQPFHKEYWLKYCTLKETGCKVQPIGYPYIKTNGVKKHYTNINIDTSVLEAEWEEKGRKGRVRGTAIHNYLENAFKGKYFTRRSKLLDRFVSDHNHLIPIALEQIVSNFTSLAGQVDAIMYNMELDRVILIDYKTDKELDKSAYGKMKPPFSHMKDSKWNKYVLQLNTYTELLKPVLHIAKMYIVHFTDESYEKLEVPFVNVTEFVK